MYSPPSMGGADRLSVSNSASRIGTSTRSRCASISGVPQREATNRRAKSRQKANAGGRGVATSTAPRCKSPVASQISKALQILRATLASRAGSSEKAARSSTCPFGESDRATGSSASAASRAGSVRAAFIKEQLTRKCRAWGPHDR